MLATTRARRSVWDLAAAAAVIAVAAPPVICLGGCTGAPTTVLVPHVVGEKISVAEAQLTAAGLKFKAITTPGGPAVLAGIASNVVLNETPNKSRIARGTTIVLLVRY